MYSSKFYKIVYFNHGKVWSSSYDGDTTEDMAEAQPYSMDISDEKIKEMFDEDEQYQIEIWKVKFTVETI